MKKYSAAIFSFVMAGIFLAIHFITGWLAAVEEAAQHKQDETWSQYLIVWMRDVSENLQSEFIQLGVQFWLIAGGISLIWVKIQAYEQDNKDLGQQLDNANAKLDEVLQLLDKLTRDRVE